MDNNKYMKYTDRCLSVKKLVIVALTFVERLARCTVNGRHYHSKSVG